MRRLRESFEHLANISHHNNDLINKGKTPKGFLLLDEMATSDKKKGQSILTSLINFRSIKNQCINKLQPHDDKPDNTVSADYVDDTVVSPKVQGSRFLKNQEKKSVEAEPTNNPYDTRRKQLA